MHDETTEMIRRVPTATAMRDRMRTSTEGMSKGDGEHNDGNGGRARKERSHRPGGNLNRVGF